MLCMSIVHNTGCYKVELMYHLFKIYLNKSIRRDEVCETLVGGKGGK